MSNYFDQYDEPAPAAAQASEPRANHFDQYDAPLLPNQAPAPAEAPPTKNYFDQYDEPQYASGFQDITRGMRATEQFIGGAIEFGGEKLGFPGAQQYGREVREESEAAIKALPPRRPLVNVRNAGDFAEWLKGGFLENVPQMVATAGGALAGLAAAPALGIGGGLASAGGAAAVGLPLGVGTVHTAAKEKAPEAPASWWSLAGGGAIAALDSAVPGRIGAMLTKSLGREAAEAVAGNIMTKWTIAKETGKQASIESVTEMTQEAIEEFAASWGTGTAVDYAKLPERFLEAGALGFALGGISGAATGLASRPSRPSAHPSHAGDDPARSSTSTVAIEEPSSIQVVDKYEEQNPLAIRQMRRGIYGEVEAHEFAEALENGRDVGHKGVMHGLRLGDQGWELRRGGTTIGLPDARTKDDAIALATDTIFGPGTNVLAQRSQEISPDTRPAPGPIFWSRAQRLVEQKGPNAAPSEQWRSFFASMQKGHALKQDEVTWLKIPARLAQTDGRITKSEMLSYIAENMVEIKTHIGEVTPYTEDFKWIQQPSGALVAQDPRGIDYAIKRNRRAGPHDDDAYYIYRRGASGRYERIGSAYSQWAAEFEATNDYGNTLKVEREKKGVFEANYPDYILPGPREGYGEAVLTLPTEPELSMNEVYKERADFEAGLIDKYGALDYRNISPEEMQKLKDIQDRTDALWTENEAREARKYQAPHFRAIDNIIGHVRFTIRRDAEGKLTLYIEESQSDWHQAGGAYGYKGEPTVDFTAKLDEAHDRIPIAREEYWTKLRSHPLYKGLSEAEWRAFKKSAGLPQDHYSWASTDEKRYMQGAMSDLLTDVGRLENLRLKNTYNKQPPPAPFSDKGWIELVTKRMIRYAADNGIERVAFTNAKIQSQRWGNVHEQHPRHKGFVEHYDKKIPSVVTKLANQMHGKTGMTAIPTSANKRGNAIFAMATDEGGTLYVVAAEDAPIDMNALTARGGGHFDPTLYDFNRNVFETVGQAEAYLAQNPSSDKPAFYIDITPEMKSEVLSGMSLFNLGRPQKGDAASVSVTGMSMANPELVEVAQKTGEVVLELAKRLKIKKPIHIIVARDSPAGATAFASVKAEGNPEVKKVVDDFLARRITQREAKKRILELQRFGGVNTSYQMVIFPSKHQTEIEIYASMMHELGHIVDFEFYHRAPADVKLAIDAAYQKWLQENQTTNRKFKELIVSRDTFISVYGGMKWRGLGDDISVRYFADEDKDYWLGMAEWMAETVSKYLTAHETPLSVVDRFFSSLSRAIRDVRDTFAKKFGLEVDAPDAITKWLDSLITLEKLDYGAAVRERDIRTQEENRKAMEKEGHPDFPVTPQTPESGLPRRLLKMLKLLDHPRAGATLAAIDRFNVFYKYMLSLPQVAAKNLHIPGLQRYRELWQLKQLERANLMNVAIETNKAWGKMARGSREMADRLGKAMAEYGHGLFMSDAEQQAGIVRRPTPAEYKQLQIDHKLSDEAMAVFYRVQADFDFMLDKIREADIAEAMKITNPTAQARALLSIEATYKKYKQIPYMPFSRYGEYTVSIYNAAGKLVNFQMFESEALRKKALPQIEADLFPDEKMSLGFLSEEVRPLIGLPPGLLDKINDRLGLTQAQKDALEQLKYDFAPIHGFRRHFQRRKSTPGYSLDFQRGYLNYFFFGSNYLTNVKYKQPMMDQIKEVKDSARPLEDGTRRGRIASFMSNHLNYTMDPRPDWATFRQAATLWSLGAVPAAATVNLSQLVVGAFPFLSSKFGGLGVGDARAMKALTQAGATLSTYYRRGKYATMLTEQDLRGLNEAVKSGLITEALAHELAAASEADNLRPAGTKRTREIFNWVLEKSMWMFEMTEQMNRRITFRAAWRLALDHPSHKYVADSIVKHNLAYQKLIHEGWNQAEAAAFVTAKDAVEQTQYIYSQWASPHFMRGRLRTVFLFKSFVQNTLFMMYSNPAAGVRSFLIMAFLGGLMGVPGAEDLRGIIKMLAYRIFGKDFDIEDEARKYVIEILDGKIPPDLILHGAARRGFGVSSMLDMVGVPYPTFDRSRAIGLGTILPLDFGVLGGPHKDTSRAIAESAQKASGAAFGVGFNLYKFLTDSQLSWSDSKRWQMALPRSLQSATKSFRYYTREEEVNRLGNRVVRFDTSDPRHLAEIVGQGMGYTPFRLAAQWDRIMAEREAVMYWNIRRETILRQLWESRTDGKQYEHMLGVVRNFNGSLPEEARLKRIDAATIRQSFQARQRARTSQEGGIPRVRADIPLVREIQRRYPEAEVDVRTVR